MDNRDFKHKNKDRLCYCCDVLQPTADSLHEFEICDRGYGSIFDGFCSTVQLCDTCKDFIDPQWFNEEPFLKDSVFEVYNFEDEIKKFIGTWIIENQEYVLNGLHGETMRRQDWIDYKNGILPENKMEGYGILSPRQEKAYNERFPTCNYPINIVYNLNSNSSSDSSRCEFDASGLYGQVADINLTASKCYLCEHYVERFEPIREMDVAQYGRYMRYIDTRRDYLKYKDEFES